VQNAHITPQWQQRIWPANLPRALEFTLGLKPLFEYLAAHATAHPQRPALVFYNKVVSYRQWDEMSNSFAQFLMASGIRKGDRVALFLPTFPGFAIAHMGISKMGGVITACSSAFKEWELEYQLKDSEARVLVYLDEYARVVEPVLRKVHLEKVVVTGYRDFLDPSSLDEVPEDLRSERSYHTGSIELLEVLRNFEPVPPNVDIDLQNDVALFQYTGGTTGLPKGALHTYYTVLYKTACRAQVSFNEISTESSDFYMLTMAPIYHIAGMLHYNASLYKGVTQVMMPRFQALDALKAIDRYKPVLLNSVTPMNLAMMSHPDVGKYDLRSIRRNFISSLGVPLTKEITDQWREYIGEGAQIVETAYGLTETHTGDTFMPLDRPPKWGELGEICVGIPTYGTEFKIISLEDRAKTVPIGEVGEIAVLSPSNFKGYWRKPGETAATLIDGWVFTGDTGRIDEDGYIYWLGRVKEMIKVSGYSVFPDEVELFLKKHPAVAACGVRGIPDPRKGEVIKAAVVLKEEFRGRIGAEEIIRWAKEKMSHYKVPAVVEIREELPQSGTGKILRRLL